MNKPNSWMYFLVVIKRIGDGKILRNIPVKQCMVVPDATKTWIQKNVVYDTKKFKFNGSRVFLTRLSDTKEFGIGYFTGDEHKKFKPFVRATDYMNTIICQLHGEGVYKPRESMILLSLIGKKQFYESYQKYNNG